jgi:hypothetical protein
MAGQSLQFDQDFADLVRQFLLGGHLPFHVSAS